MTAFARVAVGAALSVAVALVTYAPAPARAALNLPATKAEMLRIRYWDCRENQNNDVIQTDTGSSHFCDFTFDKATPKAPPPAQSR